MGLFRKSTTKSPSSSAPSSSVDSPASSSVGNKSVKLMPDDHGPPTSASDAHGLSFTPTSPPPSSNSLPNDAFTLPATDSLATVSNHQSSTGDIEPNGIQLGKRVGDLGGSPPDGEAKTADEAPPVLSKAVRETLAARSAVLDTPPRTESPTPIHADAANGLDGASSDSDSSINLSDYSSASDGENSRPEGVAGTRARALPQDRPTKSRAATLAQDAMDSPVRTRHKMGKPLSQLRFEDVQLSDSDVWDDIQVIWKALHLFMNSRMIEAEEICTQAADHRLYYSVGYSLIQAIKSLATFEPEDLESAIGCCKDSIVIAQLLRKKDHSFWESGMRLAKGSTSVNNIKAMTLVQRHAELVYSECTLLKAVLGIIYSGDFVAFLKEALNMRNAYSIYRTLAKYVEAADEAYGGEDPKIDQDFRSGVSTGNGLISLILSLLPSTVLKIMEVFGFTGDREYALKTLMQPGKWRKGVVEPGQEVEHEGLRRAVADMVLLMHHLVISSYLPVGGVDVPTASNILHYNLDRYPNGVFFLYFAGRLHSTETQLEQSVEAFHRAIETQKEYIQLAHLCHWDLGLVSLAMGNMQKAHEAFSLLDKESNWSKAIYAYAKAVTLYEQGHDPEKVVATMKQVPDLVQRIAGKSIPLEKFVARRSKKFSSQGNRLCLAGLELAYVLNCLNMSPRFTLMDVHLDQVSRVLAELHDVEDPSGYENYWDDYCLAHLLRGIVLRFIAFPEPQTTPRPKESPIPPQEAGEQAESSFNNVFKHGRELQFDHHLVWFAHYELGRLYEARKQYAKAKEQFDQVMSGKGLEISGKKGKGKVTLQNMAVLRTNSALQALRDDGKI